MVKSYKIAASEENKELKSINSLFGSWGKGITGISFLKKIRYSMTESLRDKYLKTAHNRSI